MTAVLSLWFVVLLLVSLSVGHLSTSIWRWYQTGLTDSTQRRLGRLFLFTDARRILLCYLAVLVLVPVSVYWLFRSFPLVVFCFVVVWRLPGVVLDRLELRRKIRIIEALPDTLAQLAGALRSGLTLTNAMTAVVEEHDGPLSQEFSLVLREHRLGTPFEEAMDNLAERVQAEELDLVVTASIISREVGGNLAEIFQRLSQTLRRKLEMEGKVRALTAQGVLQGWVVSLLPFAVMLALFFLERDAITPLFTSLLGWVFLFAVAVMEILGGLMIRNLVRVEI